MSEIGSPPTVYYPTVPRPWVASPVEAQFRRDPVTGTPYVWNVTSGRWEPAGPNDIPFTLYVDGVAGNDAAAGDIANPVQTVMEAIRRLPKRILHDAVVDIADNGGAVLLYDERLFLEDVAVEGTTTLRFVGKSAARVSIAAGALNSGTYRTWTISPSPGWVPNAYVGQYVEFTAGPHTGITAWIIGNTADTLTLGYYPWPWEGAYGPTDAGTIYEVTTQIRQQSLPWTSGTLNIRNVSASLPFPAIPVRFDLIHLLGDLNYKYAMEANGQNSVRFTRCRIDDYVSLAFGATGYLAFQECLAWTCKTMARGRWFSNYPGSDTTVVWTYGGIIGGFVLGENNGFGCHLMGFNAGTDPINPTNSPTNLFVVGGRHIEFYNGSIDGGGIRTPVIVTGTSYAHFWIASMDIFASITSGIRFEAEGFPGICIEIDEYYDPVWQPLSNFRNNVQYGIDLIATGKVTFFGPTQGSANGVGGMRIRDGGFAMFVGPVGSEPTLTGVAPATQIDFDARSPILWLPWTTDQTGLETLCRYAYRGF